MKDFRTIDEQINILKNRGLIISDIDFAKIKLQENNYYNIINGYKDIFTDYNQSIEMFYSDVTFEELFALYSFDRNIRNIFLSYIIEIENILRSLISYEFSKAHGHDNYLKFNNFETLSTLRNTGIKQAEQLIEERAFKIQKLIAEMQTRFSNCNRKV